MRYTSTRGQAEPKGFADAVLTGLAPDGGLYVPETWPMLSAADLSDFRSMSYHEVATRVMLPFVGDDVPADDFAALVEEGCSAFDHQAVVPLTQIGSGEWILELFHGPSLSFKDVALQIIGPLFEHLLRAQGRRVTIVGATSGDTGSAAIEAFRGSEAAEIFIMYPHERISEMQRKQMTAVPANNVHVIAVEGTFDDCQKALKAMFADTVFRDEVGLAAVNSINWARIMAQIVYYVTASVHLGSPATSAAFSVPTGNFGDIYAGFAASRMGLPISRLIVAANVNDILVRCFTTGAYEVDEVQATMSPAMDIQVSSNFERFLYEIHERDGEAIAALFADLAEKGGFHVTADALARSEDLFSASSISEDETLATMRDIHAASGVFIDPHTAVGLAAGRRYRTGGDPSPLVTMATAHAAKFPDAVREATGEVPSIPAHLGKLLGNEERFDVLPNDLNAIREQIRSTLR